MNLVNHLFAKSDELPQIGAGLYEYVVASNGVFVRAQREGIAAMIWSASTFEPIRGLCPLSPYVELDELVPDFYLWSFLNFARSSLPNEALGYISRPWKLHIPPQRRTPGGVRPLDPYQDPGILVDIHSHGVMPAFFSATDNKDETGFRIYAVVGCLDRIPEIRVRVGIYGHTWEIPASWAFRLPGGIRDAYLDGIRRASHANLY